MEYRVLGSPEVHSTRANNPSAPLVSAARSRPSEPSSGFAFNIWSCGSQTRETLASRLGDRLYELEAAGAEMELDDVVALALES
jgi:hypothetical protein